MTKDDSLRQEPLVCLRVFDDSFTANLALTKLHAYDIPAELDGNLWTGVLGVAAPGQGIRLMVFKSDVERAAAVIADV